MKGNQALGVKTCHNPYSKETNAKSKSRKINVYMKENKYLFFVLCHILRSMVWVSQDILYAYSETYIYSTSPHMCRYG